MIQQKKIWTIFARQKAFFQANLIENSEFKCYKKSSLNPSEKTNRSTNLVIKSPERATMKFLKLFQRGWK